MWGTAHRRTVRLRSQFSFMMEPCAQVPSWPKAEATIVFQNKFDKAAKFDGTKRWNEKCLRFYGTRKFTGHGAVLTASHAIWDSTWITSITHHTAPRKHQR